MTAGQWYFYLQKGKTAGPFGKDQVAEAISRGQLGPFDLIYREGEEKWQPLHQFHDFKDLFKSQIKLEIEDSWVVLVRRDNENGVSYLQRGPFSSEKVKKLLHAGEIRYRDFIWREGQAQWIRISAVELFSPPPVAWTSSVSLPQDVKDEDERTKQEILQEVLQKRNPSPVLEIKPEEAQTEDLTAAKPSETIRPAVKHVSKVAKVPYNSARRADAKTESAFQPLPRRRWPLLWGAGIFLILVLGGFIYMYRSDLSRFIESYSAQKKPMPIKKAPVVVEKKVEAPPTPTPAVGTEKVEPEKVEPTKLRATATRGGDAKAVVTLTTNGSVHFPLQVQVWGDAGDILGQVSLYRELTLRVKNEGQVKLEAEDLGLPEGQYLLRVRVKDLKDETRFRVGRDNREFRSKLDRHRKLISLPFQRERRRVIQASSELHKLGFEFLQLSLGPERLWNEGRKQWRENLTAWNKTQLEGLQISNPKSLVFPRLWQELLDQQKELKQLSQDFEQRRRANQPMELSQLKKWLELTQNMADRSKALSLYQ